MCGSGGARPEQGRSDNGVLRRNERLLCGTACNALDMTTATVETREQSAFRRMRL